VKTGSGKELLARSIHDLTRRRARPMVKVNYSDLKKAHTQVH
jgi:transcriptional regulator with GAF, ATPase, and Fis domain